MELEISNNKTKDQSANETANGFVEDLKEYIEKNNSRNSLKIDEKYNEYWDIQNTIYEEVCAILGLSRLYADNLWFYDKTNYIENELLKLNEKEPLFYVKEWGCSSDLKGNLTFSISKYENGKAENLLKITMPENEVPDKFEDENVIFQYDEKNNIIIRDDLKQEVIAGACKSMDKVAQKYKQEIEDNKKERTFI